jgi:hypothetical protein
MIAPGFLTTMKTSSMIDRRYEIDGKVKHILHTNLSLNFKHRNLNWQAVEI